MAKLTTLAVIAAAAVTTLAACSVTPPNRPPSIVTNEVPTSPAWAPFRRYADAGLAAAGASSAGASRQANHSSACMCAWTTARSSTWTPSAREFTKGTRVQLSQDRIIKRL